MEKLKPAHAMIGNGEFRWIYETLPIMAIKNEKGKYWDLYNGEFYEIIVLLEDKMLIGNKTTRKGMWIKQEQLESYFSPAYAITVNKAQGATIDRPYSIWEFQMMDKHSKYTELSRATNENLISIYNYNVSVKEALNLDSGRIAYIYEISDGINNYIGSTNRTIDIRFEEHKEAHKCENWKLYEYMSKIGVENFKIREVCKFKYVSESQIRRVEQYYIQRLKSTLNERDPVENYLIEI